MPKLVIMRGLPASGKTLYSFGLVKQGYKRINFDDLRLMMDNGEYSKANEAFIVDCAQTMTVLALQSGLNVVYDNVNFNPYHIRWARALTKQLNAELEIVDMPTSLEECLERDLNRTSGRVGKSVIIKLHDKYFVDGKYPEVVL